MRSRSRQSSPRIRRRASLLLIGWLPDQDELRSKESGGRAARTALPVSFVIFYALQGPTLAPGRAFRLQVFRILGTTVVTVGEKCPV